MSSRMKTLSTPSSVAESTSKEGIDVFYEKSGYLHCYGPENNSWKEMQEMNKDMKNEYFTAVTVDDFIYVLLENKAFYRLNYNDKDATWERMADMLEDHGEYPPAVVLNNIIYVIGSSDLYNDATNDFENDDPDLNIWTRLNNTLQPLNGPGLSVFQNKIYCFGGYSSGQLLNIVNQFDAEADVWKAVSHMYVANSYTAVVTVDESIYILGGLGFESTTAVWRFNPISNNWQSLNPMLTSRYSFNAFAITGYIYAVGGCDNRDSLEKYNIAEDKWELIETPERMELQMFIADTLSRAYIDKSTDTIGKGDVFHLSLANEIDMLKNIPVLDKTMHVLQKSTEKDSTMQTLRALIEDGWPITKKQLPRSMQEYFNFREDCTVQNGLILK